MPEELKKEWNGTCQQWVTVRKFLDHGLLEAVVPFFLISVPLGAAAWEILSQEREQCKVC